MKLIILLFKESVKYTEILGVLGKHDKFNVFLLFLYYSHNIEIEKQVVPYFLA